MDRYGWNPFLRFPRASLLLTALLAVPIWYQWVRFHISAEAPVLLEGDQRNLASYEKVKQLLGDVDVVVISLKCKEVFSNAGLDAVRRVSDAFARQPGVEEVKSLTHSYKPVRRGLQFEMVPFVPPGPLSSNQLAQLKAFSLHQPLVRNVMVAADSQHTLILVHYRRSLNTLAAQRQLRDQINATLAPFRREGLHFQVLALPLIEEEIRTTLHHDLVRFLPLATGLVLIILWWTFRSGRALTLVLFSLAVTVSLVPGIIQACGFRFNIFNLMLFPMLIGIQLTLLAHLFSSFQRAFVPGTDVDAALRHALDVVFQPANFATVTTVVGLLSLTLGGVPQTRNFGLVAALGLSLVHVMTFGPTLALMKVSANRWLRPTRPVAVPSGPAVSASAGFRRLTAFALKRRQWILAGGGLVLIIAGVGLRLVRTDIRAVEFLNPDSPTRQAIEALDRIYGGINVVQIDLNSGVEGGVNQLPFLRYVDRLQHYAEAQPALSGAYSYAQLLAMMNQLWENDRPGSFRLPDSPLLINLFVLALKSYDPPFLTALADRQFRVAYLVLRTRDMPANEYLGLIHRVVAEAKRLKPPGVTVSAAAGIHSILEADREIIRNQVNSVGWTVGVIGLVLALLWRSLRLAFVCLLTNVIPVALVVAVAGYAQLPLNSITVMVAAISLGIAVDNSIHLITFWRAQRRQGADSAAALQTTFAVKGRPIIWTSTILIAVFAVFCFSSFPPVVDFGVLSAIAFAGALASGLCFLPALLSLL